MTQERITLSYEKVPSFYQQLQTHPLYVDLITTIESGSPPQLNFKSQTLSPRSWRRQQEGR
jgi:hypothetical protein